MSRFEVSNTKELAKLQNQTTTTLISEILPSQTAIPLKGLTIGNFFMPRTYVILDTITLG